MLELGMRRQRTDPPGPVFAADAAQARNLAQVDEQRRRREPQLHQRDQRVSAGEQLGILATVHEHLDRLIQRPGDRVVEFGGDHAGAPAFPLASWIAPQIRIGLSGMSMNVTPSDRSASSTALRTAGVAAIVPASPTPLTPSVLTGDGVSVRSVS